MNNDMKNIILELLISVFIAAIIISLGMIPLSIVFLLVYGQNIESQFLNMFLYLFFDFGIPCIKVGLLIPFILISFIEIKKIMERLAAR